MKTAKKIETRLKSGKEIQLNRALTVLSRILSADNGWCGEARSGDAQ